MRIAIVEDDPKIADNVRSLLENQQYLTDVFYLGNEAAVAISSGDFDLAIVDWMLPDCSGVDVITELRNDGVELPILMLTARTQESDVVAGLSAGADDYLTKPFRMQELLARVASLLRRQNRAQQTIVEVGDLAVDTQARTVTVKGKSVELAPKEYELLAYLIHCQGRPVDRLTLLSHVWGGSIDELSNTVDVHIRYLRKKLGSAAANIQTVKGVGYRLCEI